ncbi:starch synthase [Thermodesulfovibrio aggregans]|uniref:Glycogen synthase n=1 Tax=Thermodesulfovibrio aggregans TaxID=86166 RepID=A0A0U9HRW0_9BACT|nr:glycogen synthase GlgA [Thermodesulfovibrio aggregans]GAQ95752.1 starch synthase [Thermodesulfovibrio aggregans]
MKVALVSAEAYPFSKTGGLGDVVGALFKEFIKAGIDVSLFLPFYRTTKQRFSSQTINAGVVYGVPVGSVKYFGAVRTARVSFDEEDNLKIESSKQGNLFLIEHNDFFDRDELYGTSYGEYLDNAERFVFFSRAVLEICKIMNLNFDIIHCHDWHTALIPLYLKTFYKECRCFEKTKTVLTIHNLGYQGIFPREKLEITGFGQEMFHIDGFEFYGMVNFLKVGLFNADVLTTVSPTYAREILTPEYGAGLDGVLRKRKESLVGIINGIDYKIWNPEKDPFIVQNYGLGNLKDKQKNKEYLLSFTNIKSSMETPLIGFVGRLVYQKGIDIIADAISGLIEKGISFIVEGTGEAYYENKVRELQSTYPSKVYAYIGFDEALAHKIYAGVDGLLVPSRYEPCGLNQLIAMRYGTPPICRRTGGLSDTVEDGVTGFLFDEYSAEALTEAVERFISAYTDKDRFYRISYEAMSRDFSWTNSSMKYLELYKGLIDERKTGLI